MRWTSAELRLELLVKVIDRNYTDLRFGMYAWYSGEMYTEIGSDNPWPRVTFETKDRCGKHSSTTVGKARRLFTKLVLPLVCQWYVHRLEQQLACAYKEATTPAKISEVIVALDYEYAENGERCFTENIL